LTINRINPAKLPLSKWTAVSPRNREKHFIVTGVQRDEAGRISGCILEAVHSHREYELDWAELKNPTRWRMGWL
jgi:tryptophan-rich hypothetical protein